MSKFSSKVTPFLWFDKEAEAAAACYVALFDNSRIVATRPGANGSVTSVIFELDGREFIAFNGGPHCRLTEGFSMFVQCADQAEVDRYWEALTAQGGVASRCGWLKDRFGLSWQIVPEVFGALLADVDRAKAARVMQAMLTMSKLDIAALQKASAG